MATIAQTDFGIKPLKGAAGGLRLKNQVDVNFDILAERAHSSHQNQILRLSASLTIQWGNRRLGVCVCADELKGARMSGTTKLFALLRAFLPLR